MIKINKKGEQKTIFNKLIAIILLGLVLIFVFFLLISADMRDKLDNLLPDFIPWKGDPPDLTVDAVVYDTEVKLLINDGDSRCIIEDVTDQEGDDYNLEQMYGMKEKKLNIKDKNDNWIETRTGFARITNGMLERIELPAELSDAEEKIFEKIKDDYREQYLTSGYNPIEDPSGYPGSGSDNTNYLMWKFFIDEEHDLSLVSLDDENIDGVVRKRLAGALDPSELSNYNIQLVEENLGGKVLRFFQSTEDHSLYVRGGAFYEKEGDALIPLDNKNYPSKEVIKKQLIKQDLFVGCYRDEDNPKHFRKININGNEVTLLLKDENKRCLIYSSPQDRSLEHYALKKNVFLDDELYYLDENGEEWDGAPLLTEKQKGEIGVISKLEELDKLSLKLLLYFRGFQADICPMNDRTQCYVPTSRVEDIQGYLDEIDESYSNVWNILPEVKSLADKQDDEDDGRRIYFTNSFENVEKQSFNNVLREFAKREGVEDRLICSSSKCYISVFINGNNYKYSDGAFEGFKSEYLGKSDEEIASLLNRDSIKQDLQEAC